MSHISPLGRLSPLLLLLLLGAAGCSSLTTDPTTVAHDDKGFLGGLSRKKFSTQLRRAVGKGPDQEVAKRLYQDGEELYRQAARLEGQERRSRFARAAAKYKAAAVRWPDSALEEDAMFMAGDCYFFADQYWDANDQFEELLKSYPNSRHLDRAESRRFSIARYWEQLTKKKPEPFYAVNLTDEQRPWRDTKGHAMRVYDNIRIDDPTGKLADDATMAAANLHFERGEFIQADEYYTDLRQTFPSSEHQFMAHFLGMRAKLASYQGVDYSGTVLDQAEELIKKIRTQFPREAQQNREFLDRTFAEIRFRKAEREWATAQYYDRRKEFGAARFHYAALLKDYPQTPFAEKAQSRVGDIHGLPDVPPQKLEWLVELFPHEEELPLKAAPLPGDEPAVADMNVDATGR